MIVRTLVLTLLLYGGIECDKGYGRLQDERFFIEKDLSPVVLIKKFENNEISTICTGTIIHRRRVLTAGRCLVNEDGNLDLTNIYVWSESIDLTYGGVNKAESALIHPMYHKGSHNNDIAVLTIKGEFSPYVIPMLLSEEDVPKEGPNQCKISGWEDTSWNNIGKYLVSATEEQFRKASIRSFGCGDHRCGQKEIEIIQGKCEEKETIKPCKNIEMKNYTYKASHVPDNENQMKMIGGPVICFGVQYGIVSQFLAPLNNVTTILTSKISHHLPWIIDILGSNIGLSKEPTDPEESNSGKSSLNVTYKFPPVVSIYIVKNDKKLYPNCTGTIIHKQIVLTTASCVTDGTGDPIQTGLYIRSGTDVLLESNFHKPSQIVLYPMYRISSQQHNIALIKVDVNFTDDIEPIKLGTSDIPKDEESSCGIFGWRESNRFVYSRKDIWPMDQSIWVNNTKYLCGYRCEWHNFTFSTVPDKNCSELMIKMNIRVKQWERTQFCVNAGVYDTCNGQLGEPVICSKTQYGIVTRRFNCLGKIKGPTVISRIGYYRDWIVETMESLVTYINHNNTNY